MGRAGVYEWKIRAGDDEDLTIEFVAITFDGARVWKAQVRTAAGAPDPALATLTSVGPAGIVASSNAGMQKLVLSLSAAQTRAIAATPRRCAVWDLQWVVGGKTTTILEGPVSVKQDVTV